MSEPSVFSIAQESLTLGAVLARGANGTVLYKANLRQGERTIQVLVPACTEAAFYSPASFQVFFNRFLFHLCLAESCHMPQVAVKKLNTAGASSADEAAFLKEVRIAQLASATCQRACRILGCCKLDGNPCLVMSLYASSAAKHLETLQGIQPYAACSIHGAFNNVKH